MGSASIHRDSPHERRRRPSPETFVRWLPAAVVVAAASFGLANGVVQGRPWVNAAGILADWSHGYGSLDWMDQVVAVVLLCLGGGLIGFGGGILTGVLPMTHRWLVVVAMVSAVVAGSLVSFLVLTGIDGEGGFPAGRLAELGAYLVLCTAIGASAGYFVGRPGRSRPPPRA